MIVKSIMPKKKAEHVVVCRDDDGNAPQKKGKGSVDIHKIHRKVEFDDPQTAAKLWLSDSEEFWQAALSSYDDAIKMVVLSGFVYSTFSLLLL